MFEMFRYQFFVYAMLAGLAIGITTALLSNFLVLKNQALIGDGLAHVSFAGIIVGMVFVDEPIWIAIPVVIVATLLIKWMMNSTKVRGDAAIGIVSSLSLAAGFIIISLGSGYNRSIEGLLVGSILTVDLVDILLSGALLVGVLVFMGLSYQRLFSITYDYEYAKFTKINVRKYDVILSIFTAVTIVLGVQSVGILLISSLIIFPAISAIQIAKSFKQSVVFAVIINVLVVFFGLYAAHLLNIPSGSAIVVTHGIVFGVTILLKTIRRNN
jgi:zinc transport system permease protein